MVLPKAEPALAVRCVTEASVRLARIDKMTASGSPYVSLIMESNVDSNKACVDLSYLTMSDRTFFPLKREKTFYFGYIPLNDLWPVREEERAPHSRFRARILFVYSSWTTDTFATRRKQWFPTNVKTSPRGASALVL